MEESMVVSLENEGIGASEQLKKNGDVSCWWK